MYSHTYEYSIQIKIGVKFEVRHRLQNSKLVFITEFSERVRTSQNVSRVTLQWLRARNVGERIHDALEQRRVT